MPHFIIPTFTTVPAAGIDRDPITGLFTVTGSLPLTVDFTNTTTSGGVSYSINDGRGATWLWDFGDGTTDATTDTPSHIYATAGTYLVNLTRNGTAGPGTNIVVTAGSSTNYYILMNSVKLAGSVIIG